MAKSSTQFVCQSCGAVHGKWSGRCDACGEWNTLVEETAEAGPAKGGLGPRPAKGGRRLEIAPLAGQDAPPPRVSTGVGEFDRVLGGGLTHGSAILVGGDPGIGKSTLLLQAAAGLGASGGTALYVSGEEASAQIRMRAARLGLSEAPVMLASATNLRDVVATIDAERPTLTIIDSIQTMWADTVESAPGSVAQVRASAHELTTIAKRRGGAVIMVGHVTKDGQIAGPRVMEHMVDTVLYFEGDRGHAFRILRAVKNRFGAADEIGVFEMTSAGLAEVSNPSALFLGERDGAVSGAAVFAGFEGSRPMLVEIQALVASSTPGSARRAAIGLDPSRLAMVMAVLEARCGVSLAGSDVYVSVAGGLKVSEPAADLAVAAALLSARFDRPTPPETVLFGEIGLSGRVRPASQTDARLKEALRLGFRAAWAPGPTGGAEGSRAAEPRHEDAPSRMRDGPKSAMDLAIVDRLDTLVAQYRDTG